MEGTDRTGATGGGAGGPTCPVVGIGTSAGGLAALTGFFGAVPPDCALAFIVVQHQDPAHESALAELLGRSSPLPVERLADDTTPMSGRVYVAPSNAVPIFENGRIHLAAPAETRPQAPIDRFFTSLAEDQGANAACVILSGAGTDGTRGLRAVKERGGITLAQADAEYDSMMRSALGTGLLDYALPVNALPAKLVEYFAHLARVGGDGALERARADVLETLPAICALLRDRTGHDFSGYKESTVIRRVQRRMQVLQVDDAAGFLSRLRGEPHEIDALFQDVLIGVTEFFRDPAVFAALERLVVPRLLKDKGPDDTIRVWVPACATGEEAYSIAILLHEKLAEGRATPTMQVFGSDIDEKALEIARFGRYPASSAGSIPPERLRRYFVREDGSYRVAGVLREMCLFAAHDVLRDPPFSRLDLVSCRNLLIYMNAPLQDRLLPLFHYALRQGGFLFLGTSENVTRRDGLFAPLERGLPIFRRQQQARATLPAFPMAPKAVQPQPFRPAVPEQGAESLRDLAERSVLERHTPVHVVINTAGDVLHASARTGDFLEMPSGTPDTNLFAMARHGLQHVLRAVVKRATDSGRVAVQERVPVPTAAGESTIDLVVQPLRRGGGADAVLLVVFREGSREYESDAAAESADPHSATIEHLEAELRASRHRLQTTTEELETSNGELKSANEELSSINEELHSSNEELESSTEELQSINEELETVNAELKARVDELDRANSDMANLLSSTQIATVFLDRDLRVKSFTPAARDLFRLVDSDIGRPIAHIRARFLADALEGEVEEVLRNSTVVERRVDALESDAHYIMRILPYRSSGDAIGGVVITFVDVGGVIRAESRIAGLTDDLRDRVNSQESLLDLVPVGIMITEDARGESVRMNRHGARLLGLPEGDALRNAPAALPLQRDGAAVPRADQPLLRSIMHGETVTGSEGRLVRTDGATVDVLISSVPLLDEVGRVRGAIAAVVDISERRQAEAQQDLLLHELQHRVKNILATTTALAQRMLRADTPAEIFAEQFLARLQSMARTHELLSQRQWAGADLAQLVTASLEPYVVDEVGSQMTVKGPPILLRPNAVSTLGLVLHELASNAAKYGALGTKRGRIEVSWRVEGGPDKALMLTWRERGGRKVAPPTHEGFGTNFIRRSLSYELDGSVDLDFRTSGLCCTIMLPLASATAEISG